VALFKPADPLKKAQRDLEAALATRDGLVEKRKAAETAIAGHREKARQLARDGGDDDALTSVESAMRAQQDRSTTLIAAIADVEATIAALEREINGIVDQRMRAETAQAIGTMAREIEDVAAEYSAVAQRFENSVKAVALIAFEAPPIFAFIESARTQLSPAIISLLTELQQRAAAVIAGTVRASLPAPEIPAPKLRAVPSPPSKDIVALKNIKYVDPQKRLTVCIGRWQRHSAPVAIAEMAMSKKLAVALNDPLVRNCIGMAGAIMPEARNCESVDGLPDMPAPKGAQSAAPIMASSPFEPNPNIGKPVTVRVPVEPLPMAAAGARSMPTEET
jgi:hypothetical protein